MTQFLSRRHTILMLASAGLVAAGCAQSKPSNFYTLSSLRGQGQGPGKSGPGPAVGVGPITLPPYLDRPQIVTRSSANKLELAEFHKWAESLKDIFSRTMADNLGALLGTDQVAVLPRRRNLPTDYQVEIDVTQFDTTIGGQTLLAARWTLFGKDGERPLVTKESAITSSTTTPKDYESVVAAMSQAVEQLSQEIAQAIKARA